MSVKINRQYTFHVLGFLAYTVSALIMFAVTYYFLLHLLVIWVNQQLYSSVVLAVLVGAGSGIAGGILMTTAILGPDPDEEDEDEEELD